MRPELCRDCTEKQELYEAGVSDERERIIIILRSLPETKAKEAAFEKILSGAQP